MRFLSATFGALGLLVAPVVVLAAPTLALSTASPVSEAPQRGVSRQLGPLWVEVTAEGYPGQLSREVVAQAVAEELAVELAREPELARARLVVRVASSHELSARLYSEDGEVLTRVVRAPGRADEIAELVALLAANMTSDEAEELLDALRASRSKPEENSAPDQATPAVAATAMPPVQLENSAFNASLAHPLALDPDSHLKRVRLEFGLGYSRLGDQQGLALSLGLLRVHQPAQGVQLAGVILDEEGLRGLRIAWLASLSRGQLHGLSLGGLAELHQGSFYGVQVGGLAAASLGESSGVQLGGLVSLTRSGGPLFQLAGLGAACFEDCVGVQIGGIGAATGGALTGAQIATLAVYSGGLHTGVQLGGLAAGSSGAVVGAQIGGLSTFAPSVDGLQLAGLANLARRIQGVQIGLFNLAGKVSGAQIGLINIADEVDGVSLGLFTYSRKGRTQPVLWYNSGLPMNAGLRFYTGPLYTMPTLGIAPGATGEGDTVVPGFSVGARIPYRSLYLDLDANGALPLPTDGGGGQLWQVRGRALLGVQATSWLALFAGGGIRQELGLEARPSPAGELSAGIELF